MSAVLMEDGVRAEEVLGEGGAGLGRREGRGCGERYGVILIVQWCGHDRLESDGA